MANARQVHRRIRKAAVYVPVGQVMGVLNAAGLIKIRSFLPISAHN